MKNKYPTLNSLFKNSTWSQPTKPLKDSEEEKVEEVKLPEIAQIIRKTSQDNTPIEKVNLLKTTSVESKLKLA